MLGELLSVVVAFILEGLIVVLVASEHQETNSSRSRKTVTPESSIKTKLVTEPSQGS